MDSMHDDKPLEPNFKKALLTKLPDRMPFWKLLGIEFVDVGRGWAKMRMPFSEKLTNSLGIAHGGGLFALADSAGSMALVGMVEKGEFVTTIEMKINYLKPLDKGEVVAEAVIIHCGKTTAFGEIDLKDGDGHLVAKGLATFLRKRSGK
jgi:uncharacterized protein (TIGR00369 family)